MTLPVNAQMPLESPEEKAEAKLERGCTSDPEGIPREGETDGRKPGDVQQRNRTPERALWSRVMIELTPRQNEVFEAIKIHIEKAGFPPTMLELAGLIGCASPNAAVEHVKSLKKKGYITVAPGAARGITIVKTEWDVDPVTIIKDLLSGGDKARDNAVEWLKKQGVSL